MLAKVCLYSSFLARVRQQMVAAHVNWWTAGGRDCSMVGGGSQSCVNVSVRVIYWRIEWKVRQSMVTFLWSSNSSSRPVRKRAVGQRKFQGGGVGGLWVGIK